MLDWVTLCWAGIYCVGLDYAVLDWVTLCWTGLDWAILFWTRLYCVGLCVLGCVGLGYTVLDKVILCWTGLYSVELGSLSCVAPRLVASSTKRHTDNKIPILMGKKQQKRYTNIPVLVPSEIPAVICALDNKGWPPHTYFGELEEELSKLPWVELTLTDHGRPSIGPLERFIDKKLDEQMVSVRPRPAFSGQ